MIPRVTRHLLRSRLAASPAVALIGPRQCGKTTLARSLRGAYFDLEQESERLRFDLEWEELADGRGLVILDEAQSWPAAFPALRGGIDRDRKRNGRFLLLGSIAPSLMTQISESLAGRLSLVEMSPFFWTEMKGKTRRDRLWLHGGYPDGGVLDPGQYPRWQRDYLTLLAQRDLPSWGLGSRPQITERLMRMLAAVHGQLWNASQLGASLGLSYHTVNSYLDHLEGAFLIRRLPPYHANTTKRLVKSPKVYWRDTGLLHALLNVSSRKALLEQPWVGVSWEGFVIEQIIADLTSRGRTFQAYHFRTSDQHEADLVLEFGHETWALEMKLTASPGASDLSRLKRVGAMLGASRQFLVSQTPRSIGDDVTGSCNLAGVIERLHRLVR